MQEPGENRNLVAAAKALGDPLRLELLRILAHDRACCGEGVCVCDLVEKTHALQSLISYHMKILREAGLVTEQARGKWKFYALDREGVRRALSGWESLLGGETESPRN
ncbi:MAG: ArsR/SmtB family transcription factor [Chitinophagales bacterium]